MASGAYAVRAGERWSVESCGVMDVDGLRWPRQCHNVGDDVVSGLGG